MKLLFAEDDRDVSRAVVTLLERSNYTVDPVYNGNDALDYLVSGDYDAAVLDVMMPGRSGLEVVREARRSGVRIPIMMLTAMDEVDDRINGLDAGADDYLTKPFAIKELLARIRSMTRRQPELSDSVLKFGNLSLDRSDYELAGPDGSTKLANKEFQIMEMLMTNPGQVISTERFLEKIWGYDTDAEVNVVWVYISTLRKKLASLGTSVQIKAARGVGYSLEDKA